MGSCYDALAGAYLRLWEPVLGPSSRALLDRIERRRADLVAGAGGPGREPHLVDVGTGAGILALEAVSRWPRVRVTAADPSGGMLDAARMRADADLSEAQRSRLDFREAPADRLPMPDSSVDGVISSFVLQLVPNRAAALREARRVLRPGGFVALVTWIADSTPFAPADAFDDALAHLGIELPAGDGDGDGVSGDYRSASAAERQLRRAGFSGVTVETDWLDHAWDPESYLLCQEQLWESDLFETLSDERRAALREEAGRRLRALRPGEFRWRAPIVYAFGMR